jgi:hypothetical protein
VAACQFPDWAGAAEPCPFQDLMPAYPRDWVEAVAPCPFRDWEAAYRLDWEASCRHLVDRVVASDRVQDRVGLRFRLKPAGC